MSIVTHMDKGFSSYSHPTYQDLQNACFHITDFIHHNASPIGKVEAVVGITRGGLMPAVELSNQLNIPMTAVQYSSKSGAGDNKNHINDLPEIPKASRILLVDDICDSGYTLKEIHDEYVSRGYEVFSAVLYFKDQNEQTVYTPDVWAVKVSKNFGWIHYPWETK